YRFRLPNLLRLHLMVGSRGAHLIVEVLEHLIVFRDLVGFLLSHRSAIDHIACDRSEAGRSKPNCSLRYLVHRALPSDVVGVKLGASLAGKLSSDAMSTCLSVRVAVWLSFGPYGSRPSI